MIGLLFELIEWSIKLMILAFVIMVRLAVWFVKALAIMIAALIVPVVAAWERREARRSTS